MKKILVLFFLCVLFLILDNSLVPFFSIGGYYPSLLFIFIVCYSIVNGTWEGIWIGIFAGLLQDIYFFYGFGVNTLVNMLMCVIAGFIGNNIFKEKRLIPAVSVLGLSIVKGIFVFCMLYIVGQFSHIVHILFDSIYNMILSLIIYRWVYKLCQKNYMQRKWKFYDK